MNPGRPANALKGLVLSLVLLSLWRSLPLAASDPVPTSATSSKPAAAPPSAIGHWAFQPLPAPPSRTSRESASEIDRLIQKRLKQAGLTLGREADRRTLLRRVAFILTGLPPSPEEIVAFESDRARGAYERMIERYLASPRYGERWGKHWLDAAGYADSNGYFSADTDRPLAYRYRDYVIRAHNLDKPFDHFVREQLAGDELSGWKPGQPATPAIIELLEATHYLRNGQDGSGESDGNPDEVRTDRYYALESAMQIVGSSLLGLTMQCAKCHDHKFEPITQADYYAFQAVLYPAFNIDKWVKPNDRVVHAHLPGELEAWEVAEKKLDAEVAGAKKEFHSWLATNRVPGKILFTDRFDAPETLSNRWSNVAPGDDAPAGNPAVAIGSEQGPGANVREGALRIVEGGGAGDRWLSTRESFDWRPASTGQWIQATFDLVATKLGNDGAGAERIGYFIAAHDFNDNSAVAGGNILIDGNPGGPTTVHTDYPGSDAKSRGNIGDTGYKAGRNYGVRLTKTAANEFTLEHLVDGMIDGGSLKLKAEHLPPGGFAFEYCCGRSFVVDNVVIERSDDSSPDWLAENQAFQKRAAEEKKRLDKTVKDVAAKRTPKPGQIAWLTDVKTEPPQVRLLKRGNHKTPGDPVDPAFPVLFSAKDKSPVSLQPAPTALGTGRRLAWSNWLTQPGSPQASLLARVTVNRVWQHYFGTGLAATSDNLGLSGARPTHPELLDWLAAEFIRSGWSLKAMHRHLLRSAVFRQSSAPRDRGLARDPENHLLWRYPLRRLDAEAIRDAILAASGRLGSKTNGPYVPTPRNGQGEVIVDEAKPDALARSVFLQHRRTQVPTFLGNFDAPSVVFNCTRRAATTMPLQSLSLLNSEFAIKRADDLARRLATDCATTKGKPNAKPATAAKTHSAVIATNAVPASTVESEEEAVARIRRAFLLTCGRAPDPAEQRAALSFLQRQRLAYAGRADANARVWADFSQALFGLNAFLYLE